MPVEITWTEEDHAQIDIGCDACEKEYRILSKDIEDLHLCPFCGHYLDTPDEEGRNESEEDSWD